MRSRETLSIPASRTVYTARRTLSGLERHLLLRGLVQVEHGEERLLRHLDAADLLHPLLPRLLLLEQLALARDVAAVALGEHVLAARLHGLAGDDARADRGLDGDVEHLTRNLVAQPLDECATPLVRARSVND